MEQQPGDEMVPPEVFGKDVYDHFYGTSLEECSDADARLIAEIAGLQPGADVLDVPCGNGRIAVRLGQLGCRVVGVDRSAQLIAEARKRGGRGDVRFEVGDMRALGFEHEFDCVVNWFTSFGYFDALTNRAVLNIFRRALKTGGLLVLEQRNPLLLHHSIEAGGGTACYLVDRGLDLLVDRARIEDNRLCVERFVARDGQVRKLEFSVEIFAGGRLTAALVEAGFIDVELLDERGRQATDGSSRLVTLARAG